jgi:hypothetical protein
MFSNGAVAAEWLSLAMVAFTGYQMVRRKINCNS